LVRNVANRRVVIWDKENGYGTEFAEVELAADRLSATGIAIGWDPLPYRLEFTLETGAGWVTTRLNVTTTGDAWTRTLDLARSEAGTWTVVAAATGEVDLEAPGGDATTFAAAFDCDLGLSPLTNSMPALRHDLLRKDGSVDFVMAWVAVPALAVRASSQRYTTFGSAANGLRRIEYRSGDFRSELLFDPDGICADYPQLGRAVP
jgi:hypothetical protein